LAKQNAAKLLQESEE